MDAYGGRKDQGGTGGGKHDENILINFKKINLKKLIKRKTPGEITEESRCI